MTDMTPDELRAWISPATSHGVHINSKTLSAIAQTALDALDREAAMKAELARVRTDCGILIAQIDAIEDATGEGPEGDAAQVMAIYDVIYVWPDFGSASITGQWSANTHPEEAVAYVPQRVAEALAWRLRSYTTHDDDCKINKPPHFRDCSCGLRELLASMENSAALTPEPEGDAP